jgi:hypothetical protein
MICINARMLRVYFLLFCGFDCSKLEERLSNMMVDLTLLAFLLLLHDANECVQGLAVVN